MRRIKGAVLLLIALLFTQHIRADWYGDKYSMFVHYGLYSIPAGVWDGKPVTQGYSEQILTFGIGFSDWYEAYTQLFDASAFDAERIVQLAKKGGMRSVVMTAKHHDGFCLWRTQTTEYNAYDATPAQRDLIAELAEACHRNGIGFGIYFSLIDWHYPYAMPFSSHNADPITPPHHEYNKKQVEELLTKYGKVDELWFDMGSLRPEQSKELYELVHTLQPSCQVSGRVGNDYADFSVMADNEYPDYAMELPWQTAASMFDETWGYRSWQERGSAEEKAREKFTALVKVVTGGGKYLLNIGPKGDGSLVPFEEEVISQIGAMIEPIKEAIYNTVKAPFSVGEGTPWATLSAGGKELYLFVPTTEKEIYIPCPKAKYSTITLLNDSRSVTVKKTSSGLQLRLQGVSKTVANAPLTVVKIVFKEPFTTDAPYTKGKQFTPYNAEVLYAHSAIDYYTGYKSIVGYKWGRKQVFQKLLCSFTEAEQGHQLLFNKQAVELSPTKAHTEEVPINLDGITWVKMEVAQQGGRFGVHRTSFIDTKTYNASDWEEQPISMERTSKGKAEYLRYTIEVKEATNMPLEIAYSEGMMLFLNGKYIAGEIARPSETDLLHKQFFVLPLTKGRHVLTIKSYRRWGYQARVALSLKKFYTKYTQEVILTEPSNRLILKEWALPSMGKEAKKNSTSSQGTYPKARSIGLYNISILPIR